MVKVHKKRSKKPIAKLSFEGLVRNQIKVSGGTEFDGDWVRKEDPKYIRRITLEEAAKMPFEEVLHATSSGYPKLVLEFNVESIADVARLACFVTSRKWTTRETEQKGMMQFTRLEKL